MQLQSLTKERLYLGTSSWKYDGWRGLLYQRDYQSQKEFNETCLEEYAQHYPTVGVDHTYYTWPVPATFEKYFEQTPENFIFGLKVTDAITVARFPKIRRYGKNAGKTNETFLDPEIFKEKFLGPLEPFREKLGPIIFEFSQFYPGTINSGKEFVERLNVFFQKLKLDHHYQFAIEIRNQNWLKAPYFKMLADNGVGHVFNSWTRMPSIGEQLELSHNFDLSCYVSRVLLKPGVQYEKAVQSYSPYNEIKETLPNVREDVIKLLQRAVSLRVPAYVFVNNRSEGCAPLTIDAIVELYSQNFH